MQSIFNASLVKPTIQEDSALAIMLQERSLLTNVSGDHCWPHSGQVEESGHPGSIFTHLLNAFGSSNSGPTCISSSLYTIRNLVVQAVG